MKNTGIVKYIDSIGRIKIPNELRDLFDIRNTDSIEFSKHNNMLYLHKNYVSCIFCNSKKNIRYYQNKAICNNCINMIKGGFYARFENKRK